MLNLVTKIVVFLRAAKPAGQWMIIGVLPLSVNFCEYLQAWQYKVVIHEKLYGGHVSCRFSYHCLFI